MNLSTFYEIVGTKSSTILSVIKDIIMQLVFDRCCRQCYDRASNIIGKKSGVAQEIKEIQTKSSLHIQSWALQFHFL